MNLTPSECALIIAGSIAQSAAEAEKKITRFQMSLQSLSRVANRTLLDHNFLQRILSELSELGWCMFQLDNTRYAFIRQSSVESWKKIASSRMTDHIETLLSAKNNMLHQGADHSCYNQCIVQLSELAAAEVENE